MKVLQASLDLYDDLDKAAEFMRSRQRGLQCKSPLEMLDSDEDMQKVLNLIEQSASGVYI